MREHHVKTASRWHSTSILLLAFIASLFVWPSNAEVDPIVIKGSHFFYKTNGTQFFVRGIVYEDTGKFGGDSHDSIDVLSNGKACARDIQFFLKLGINTISITAVDPQADHTGCMDLLQNAGIYVLVNLQAPSSNMYDHGAQKVAYFDQSSLNFWNRIVDTLHQYSNVLGFVVSLAGPKENIASLLPTFKSNIRDIKTHIRNNNYRNTPIGAEASDNGGSPVLDFMTCGSTDAAIDFYSLWMDSMDSLSPDNKDSFASMYTKRSEDYRNASVPITVTYGHAVNSSQGFDEIQTIYSKPVVDVFSGVFIEEWISTNSSDVTDTGLVQISAKNVTTRPGYSALASQLASLRPSPTQATEYVPTNTADPVCHNLFLKNYYDFATDSIHDIEVSPVLPVSYFPQVCSCMMKSLECSVSSNINEDLARDSKARLCQNDDPSCYGVLSDHKTGRYGAYSQCNTTEQLSWMANQIYLSKKDPAACASVNGTIRQAVPSASQGSDCEMLFQQAKPDGSGTITAFPASATGIDHSKSSSQQHKGSNWDSLKTAAKAGIILGAIIAGLLFSTLAICLALRKRRRTQDAMKHDDFQKSELPDNQMSSAGRHMSDSNKHEIDGNPRIELVADEKSSELAGQETQVYELDAPHGQTELDGESLKEPDVKT